MEVNCARLYGVEAGLLWRDDLAPRLLGSFLAIAGTIALASIAIGAFKTVGEPGWLDALFPRPKGVNVTPGSGCLTFKGYTPDTSANEPSLENRIASLEREIREQHEAMAELRSGLKSLEQELTTTRKGIANPGIDAARKAYDVTMIGASWLIFGAILGELPDILTLFFR